MLDRRDSVIQRDEKLEQLVANLPDHVWQRIASYLNPADVARLSLTTKTFQKKVGGDPLRVLALPENHHHLNLFLSDLDRYYPNHLHCFPCAKFHRRIRKGHERLKTDFVANPLYNCPKVYSSYLPRIRLVHGHQLPYSFIQLAIRHEIYSKNHGIDPELLCQRWRDTETGWTHTTRYTVHDGHLLARVRSQVFAAPGLTQTSMRHLLYDPRDDYLPYFSVCAHWRDGELMRIVKCALSHIPEPPQSYLRQLRSHPMLSRSLAHPNYLAVMCDFCRPARRCPECPTEYLVEVKLTEDKNDAINPFKHALVVTRWSDLGDGSGPTASPEYCAVQGTKADYDSFTHVGRRATAGIFESKMSHAIPGQRMISLNPRNRKLGEEGHGWY
ncbi:uncharacterized protein EI97DRAFT_376359 [Westerdykella ornata]|uniref:F-box domain-containing protein n=1 Tax=Westerdykella ornata TaxID=318751 RepID=A0A6A6JJG1_WESOR|nr:uncharacterized protein EI97DRAFT_376359 [Westerdykella ornata]KAF2276780.1 hypothetical protein EI97DRAFT_376359 [Westerdykella ornata]